MSSFKRSMRWTFSRRQKSSTVSTLLIHSVRSDQLPRMILYECVQFRVVVHQHDILYDLLPNANRQNWIFAIPTAVSLQLLHCRVHRLYTIDFSLRQIRIRRSAVWPVLAPTSNT